MRNDLAGGRRIGIRSLLLTATVLAAAIPYEGAETAVPELHLNVEKLIPEPHRANYQREVLEPLHQAQKAAQKAAEERLEQQRQLEQEKAVEAVVRPVQVSDCYVAMQATWPQELWAGASIVIQRESGGVSNKIGPEIRPGVPGYNSDGSQDFGCFQINNFAHHGFFQSHDWSDAYQNAAYAYQIYLGRHNWSAWYAVYGILF